MWHREVITPAVESALQDLQERSALSSFYLGGGTGLALRLGHRRSEDLDFFSPLALDVEALLQRLGRFSVTTKGEETLHGTVGGLRVSFLGYHYPLLFAAEAFRGVEVADARDIACMKINAIAGRGAKRDFIDLYAACQEYELTQLLNLFHKKFAGVNYSEVHLLKSLSYFDEAEKDPLPDMLVRFPWEDVKEFFSREAARLL